jgi:hypothetical protein
VKAQKVEQGAGRRRLTWFHCYAAAKEAALLGDPALGALKKYPMSRLVPM